MKKMIMMIILMFLIGLSSNGFCAPGKHALVIGNSAYKEAPLQNPVNDANDLTVTLEKLGFAVIKKVNLGQQAMEEAIWEFGQTIDAGDIALFYFSGHGIQADGINYLLPVGLDLKSERDIKYKSINAEMILDTLADAKSQVNIIILDACRNNPFKRLRSFQRGLAVMSATTTTGTLIAYATAPGSTAADGDDRNSPYTKHLLEIMPTPGLKIEEVFKKVREAVMAETVQQQLPWESSSLMGDFYFSAKGQPPVANSPAPQADADVVFWQSIQNSQNPAAFEAYSKQFPNGTFASLARIKLEELKNTPSSELSPQTIQPRTQEKHNVQEKPEAIRTPEGIVKPVISDFPIYSHPGSGTILTSVRTTTDLVILEQAGKWYKVKTPGGITGWIAKDQVKKPRAEVVKPVISGFSIYSHPGSGTILTSVRTTADLTILDQAGKWYKVKTPGGITGWIAKDEVKEK